MKSNKHIKVLYPYAINKLCRLSINNQQMSCLPSSACIISLWSLARAWTLCRQPMKWASFHPHSHRTSASFRAFASSARCLSASSLAGCATSWRTFASFVCFFKNNLSTKFRLHSLHRLATQAKLVTTTIKYNKFISAW